MNYSQQKFNQVASQKSLRLPYAPTRQYLSPGKVVSQ